MRDELDRMIMSYFDAQVDGIPPRALPSLRQEAANLGEARVTPRLRRTGRLPAISTPPALRLAGAVAIAAICVFAAPPRTASLVARGVQVLIEDTELRTTLFSATAEITHQTGKFLRKE